MCSKQAASLYFPMFKCSQKCYFSFLLYQWRSQPKNWGGKEYDFRLITLFCLEKCLSKHKRTIYLTKIWGDHGPFAPLATPMFCTPMYASQIWWNFRNLCMQRLRVAYNFWMQSSIQPAMESEC